MVSWISGCYFRRTAGSNALKCASDNVTKTEVQALYPGDTVEISADLIGPSEPGIYHCVWRLLTPVQVPFGGTYCHW